MIAHALRTLFAFGALTVVLLNAGCIAYRPIVTRPPTLGSELISLDEARSAGLLTDDEHAHRRTPAKAYVENYVKTLASTGRGPDGKKIKPGAAAKKTAKQVAKKVTKKITNTATKKIIKKVAKPATRNANSAS